MLRLPLRVLALLLGATAATAQDAVAKPQTMLQPFAAQYIAMSVPAEDRPDEAASRSLQAIDQVRTSAAAVYLATGLHGGRALLQKPAEQLAAVQALLVKPDLHGQLRSQLQWYHYGLLLAAGRNDEAAAADPVNGQPREFLCVGPFGGDDDDFQAVPFAPELLAWPADAQFSGTSKAPRPVRLPIGTARVAPVDPRDGDTGCFYVLHRVRAEQVHHCYLSLWIRGAAEVFVNGVFVARVDEALGDGRAQHEVPIAFAAGCNHVVIKTCQRDRNDFEMHYVDARWSPVAGLVEVAATEPVQACAAAVAANLPPYVDGIAELEAALPKLLGQEQQSLQIAYGLVADHMGLREAQLAAIEDLEPADATLQLAAARLWRRQGLVPEDRRNAKARKLEEAAARQLDDTHFAMLRSRVGLLEEQDRREEALTRLWQVVAAGQAGPQTFRLLLGVAARAKFHAERDRILRSWQQALPNDPLVYHELALDCRKGGARRATAEYGERAIRLRPDIDEYLNSVYWPLIASGDYDKAQELCDLVMPPVLEDPSDRTRRLLWSIGIAAAEPDPARWLQSTEQLLAQPRASGARLQSTADSLLRRGYLERAQRAYEAVLSRDPDDLQVQRLLQRSLGAPEPGAAFAQFRHDGDAAIAAFRAAAAAEVEGQQSAPATTLIEQRIVELYADGSRYEEMHELRRLNDPDGIEAYGNADAPAAADEVLLLRTIDAGGDVFVPVRMQQGYSMPRLEPGVFVEWRFREHVAAPADGVLAFEPHLFGSFADDILLSELVVIRPKGCKMEIRARGVEQPNEVLDLGDGREALRYAVEHIQRIVPDTAMPALAEMVPVVAAGRDQPIGSSLRTAAHRLASMTMPSPPIRRQVASLLAGIEAPAAQLQALHDFCHAQIAEARSRSATETLLQRQGDRQQLLFAMLQTAGFELQSALCQTARQELYDADETLFADENSYFTEWCVRLQKPGMAAIWLFFDAPRYSPPGWVSPSRSGSAVLVHTGTGTELARLPQTIQHVQHMRIVGVGQVTADQLQVEVKLEMLGDNSYRAAEHFLQQPAAAQRQFARQFAQSMFQGWQVRKAEFLSLQPGGVVTVEATLRRRGLQADGERSLLQMPLPESRFLAAFGPRPERQMPMRLTSDLHLSWDLKLHLDGVQLAAVPAMLAIESGPLVYLQELQHDGETLMVKRRATMRPGRIPVSGLPSWSRTLERLERVENQSLEFVVR